MEERRGGEGKRMACNPKCMAQDISCFNASSDRCRRMSVDESNDIQSDTLPTTRRTQSCDPNSLSLRVPMNECYSRIIVIIIIMIII